MNGEENSRIGLGVCVLIDDRKTRSEGGTKLRDRTIAVNVNPQTRADSMQFECLHCKAMLFVLIAARDQQNTESHKWLSFQYLRITTNSLNLNSVYEFSP